MPKTVPLLFAPAIMAGLLRTEHPKTLTTRLDRGQTLPEVGRLMWARETFCAYFSLFAPGLVVQYSVDLTIRTVDAPPDYTPPKVCKSGAFASSLIMPQFLSCYAAPLTEVRRERLLDITEADAMREGLPCHATPHEWVWEGPPPDRGTYTDYATARVAFLAWWDHLHPDHPSASNPMVIRYGWRREDAKVWNG